jgi:hypothetical protein
MDPYKYSKFKDGQLILSPVPPPPAPNPTFEAELRASEAEVLQLQDELNRTRIKVVEARSESANSAAAYLESLNESDKTKAAIRLLQERNAKAVDELKFALGAAQASRRYLSGKLDEANAMVKAQAEQLAEARQKVEADRRLFKMFEVGWIPDDWKDTIAGAEEELHIAGLRELPLPHLTEIFETAKSKYQPLLSDEVIQRIAREVEEERA